MNRSFLIAVPVGLLLAAALAAAAAPANPPTDLKGASAARRWALVIGVGRYTDPAIPAIPFCVKDSQDLAAALTASGYEVLRLADDGAADYLKPIKSNILVQAERFLGDEVIGPEDLVLVYFSGHGFATEEGAYLAAGDTWESKAELTALRVSWLRDLLKVCHANKKVLVLDACHSGLGKSVGKDLVVERINAAAQGAGFVTLASCRANQKSWELKGVPGQPDGRNSTFTYYLVQGLKGAADRDRDGEIVLSEMNRYLYEQVTGWARRAGLEQTPVMNPASVEGEIALARRRSGSVTPVGPTVQGATLVAASDPEGAGVYVNDTLKGRTPCEVALAAGADAVEYTVELRLEGYKAQRLKVEVAAGDRAETGVVKLARVAVVRPEPMQPPQSEPITPAPAVTPPPGTAKFQTWTNPRDGMEFVFVPAGAFKMGSDHSHDDEKPAHKVTLPGYWIGKCEVTLGQYRKFMGTTGHRPAGDTAVNGKDDRLPVVNVSWHDAVAYCDWAGVRLPTEAEWEKAARGTDGREFVWGSAWPPPAGSGNFTDPAADEKPREFAPVGSFPRGASPYGCQDMAGNVWEWCSSQYKPYPFGETDGRENAHVSAPRVYRGPILFLGRNLLRVANRGMHSPASGGGYLGFRCARSE